MTTSRSLAARRPLTTGRRAAVALIAGAGIALSPLPAYASTGGSATPTAEAAPAPAPNNAAQIAVDTALAQQGDPYEWGGAGPDSFDCSGLTQYAYRAAGIELPHSSRMQSTMGTPVAKSNLLPGDLVFFYDPVGHVGMYIGNGQMVHASTYGQPVKVVNVDSMPDYHSARRVA